LGVADAYGATTAGPQEAIRYEPLDVENYRWAIDKHLRPAIDGIALAKLTPGDIDKVLFTMADGGAAQNTMMRVRAVLSTAIDDAVARRLVTWKRVSATRTPAGPRRESRSSPPNSRPRSCKALWATGSKHWG
jgi:hypothetical protein